MPKCDFWKYVAKYVAKYVYFWKYVANLRENTHAEVRFQ